MYDFIQIGDLRRMAELLQTGCEKAVGDHQENEDDGEAKSAGRPKGKQGSWHPSALDSFLLSALRKLSIF